MNAQRRWLGIFQSVLLVVAAWFAVTGCADDGGADSPSGTTSGGGDSSGSNDSSGSGDTSGSGDSSGSGDTSGTTQPVCGNGVMEGSEQCDDGNTADGDGCSSTCLRATGCGDAYVDPSEECDDGNANTGDGCNTSCKLEVCGNGIVDTGEACDGSADCTPECKDSREPLPDADEDTISDHDEGAPNVDSDDDGVPDYLDPDSDADGIGDANEVNDASTHTPPDDSDADGTPNFRDTDADGDGVPDQDEGRDDADSDGTPNFLDDDADGDGLPDRIEGSADTDNDGTPNNLDSDADGDGIDDAIEGNSDSDGDTLPAYLDADADGDGIPDSDEANITGGVALDTDADGTPDYLDADADGDGVRDIVEGGGDIDQDGTPNNIDSDSDGDGIDDAIELARDPDQDGIPNLLDLDSDGDGLDDDLEGNTDSDSDGIPNFLDLDSDNDFLSDADEAAAPCLDHLNPDSDSDTIPDYDDGTADFDADGLANACDPDSDNDGVSDAAEAGDSNPLTYPLDTDNDTRPDFRDLDSDADGLADDDEPTCGSLQGRLISDVDGDGFSDLAEVAVGSDPCNASQGVTDIVEFYFELPNGAPPQNDDLLFTPTVQRADVFFNVDTTGSMGEEIDNLKTGLSSTIIPQTQSRVSDSAFGVGHFDDIPTCSGTALCSNTCFGPSGQNWNNDGWCDDGGPGANYSGCALGTDCADCGNRYIQFGDSAYDDVAWELFQSPTTNATTAQNAVDLLETHYGVDIPESGYESLYQIATGDGNVSWPSRMTQCSQPAGSIPAYTGSGIGGVGFRSGSIPIVMHITDADSHTSTQYQNAGVVGAHSDTQTINALNAIGARTISVLTRALVALPSTYAFNTTSQTQLTALSNGTGARVPVCAFKTGVDTWRCGINQCCTGENGAAVAPTSGLCTLLYQLNQSGQGLGTAVVDGIDAIVKYGKFDVLVNARDDGNAATVNTTCFIQRVEAISYTAPPQEPETSCNPIPVITDLTGAGYSNGFQGFATGTSSATRPGASLTFRVVAQNNGCVPDSQDARTFTAYLDVTDRTTGAVLDTQTVTIIIPPVIPDEF